MPALATLRRNWEFQQVFRVGKNNAGREIVVYTLRNRNRRRPARFGFCISKKVGCAVVRNRLRRRLREICRAALPQLQDGWDIVLVARSDAAESSYQELDKAFQRQTQKLGCWSEPREAPSQG